MPTIRSLFNFEQFEEVLQKLAYKIALDAVKTLKQGDARIVIHGSEFNTVETGKVNIRFYGNHISYGEWNWASFDVEEKVYLTSHHSTKISFYAPEGEESEMAEKITVFIDKIMAEASIKPVPRFNLSGYLQEKA